MCVKIFSSISALRVQKCFDARVVLFDAGSQDGLTLCCFEMMVKTVLQHVLFDSNRSLDCICKLRTFDLEGKDHGCVLALIHMLHLFVHFQLLGLNQELDRLEGLDDFLFRHYVALSSLEALHCSVAKLSCFTVFERFSASRVELLYTNLAHCEHLLHDDCGLLIDLENHVLDNFTVLVFILLVVLVKGSPFCNSVLLHRFSSCLGLITN